MRAMRVLAGVAAMAGFVTLAGSAQAQWSVGVGFGSGGYHPPPPPPVIYGAPPPVIYPAPPPPVLYAPPPPPVVYAAPPPGVSPDMIFDALEDAGYDNFGPMQERGGVYSVSADNPRGETVILEIAVADGQLLRELTLEGRTGEPPRQRRQGGGRDPLVVY